MAAEGSMTKIKEEGKLRQEGRDYVMADGDIVGSSSSTSRSKCFLAPLFEGSCRYKRLMSGNG